MVKGFPCSFVVGVVCKHKKCSHFVVIGKCFSCSYYSKFLREMDEEEERFFDEVDKIRKSGFYDEVDRARAKESS